jgi:hypothetical protein
MKNMLAGLVLGALLLGGTAAQADTHILTTGVQVDYVNGTLPGDWNITLAGETSTGSAIALNTLVDDLSGFPAVDSTGTPVTNGNAHWGVLQVTVLPGYTVTGLRLSGAFFGDLSPAQLGGSVGTAENSASLQWNLSTTGGVTVLPSFMREDFTGQQILELSSGPQAFGDSFFLIFNGAVESRAAGLMVNGVPAMSIASADIGDIYLAITVVPEPAGWTLLLGGRAGGGRRGSAPAAGLTARRAARLRRSRAIRGRIRRNMAFPALPEGLLWAIIQRFSQYLSTVAPTTSSLIN